MDVVVSIAAGAVPDEVAGALTRAGLRDAVVLADIGVVTGAVDDPAALGAVAGVETVEAAGTIQLPPPDAPIS